MTIDTYMQYVIEPGALASAMGYGMSVESFGNCGAIEIVLDSRPEWQKEVGVVFKPLINLLMNERVETDGGLKPMMWQIPTTDGGGHKPQMAGAIGTEEAFAQLGHDLMVMQDHDILRRGGMPCYGTNFYDAKAITEDNISLLRAYFRGLGDALREARVANLTGESAVVRYAVTAFCDRNLSGQLLMNVAGTTVGLAHVDKYLDGSKIRPGMPIVGCIEQGGRCNGYTRDIDILMAYYGPEFYKNDEAMQLLQMLAVGSKSYSKTIQRVHGWNSDGSVGPALAKIVGMFHITGGGIWEKLRLPPGIGAILSKMPIGPRVLHMMQELSWYIPRLKMSDWRMHSTFNGGIGYITILEAQNDADIFVAECEKDGKDAQIIGETTYSPEGEILIYSQFKEKTTLSSKCPG